MTVLDIAADIERLLVRHPGHPDQKVHGRRKSVARAVLAEAKDVARVAAAASSEARRITGRDTEFDFTGSDVRIARDHAEGVLRGFERYPTTRLAAVRVEQLRDGVFAKVENREDGTVMLFSAKESADAKRYRDYARMEKQYKMKATGSPMGTAIHEFGHVVANQHNANGSVRTAASLNAQRAGRSTTSGHVRDEISAYATDNEYELAAEAFADVLVNGDKASALSDALLAVIDEAVSHEGAIA